MERIPKRSEAVPASAPAPAKRPDRKAARAGPTAIRDGFEPAAPSPAAKITVKAPRQEVAKAQGAIPTFSEFAKDKPRDASSLKQFVQQTALRKVFDSIQATHSADPKVKNLQGELKRQWGQLESAQKAGRIDEVASLLDDIASIVNRIHDSIAKENLSPQENIEKAPSALRLADRLTADEAAEKITEFNQLFKSLDYNFKDLKGQSFSRAEDQGAVKSKMGGKGIGPFYLNEKGDKMLAPDRDAHGGGTFKYFKKVDNQWVRQQTLDHKGKPFRT